MKDFTELYVSLKGWMIKDLNLEGNDLISFAVIHQFSQGNQIYYGGYEFLEQWGMSRRTAQRCVKKLLEKDLLLREEVANGKMILKSRVTVDASLVNLSQSAGQNDPLIINIENKKTTYVVQKEKVNGIQFDKLLQYINNATGRSFKVINKTVKASFRARLKDGYTKTNIITAIDTAVKVQSHKENGFQYLTPEFFSRQSTLDKYGTKTRKQRQQQAEETENKDTNFMTI